MIHQYLKEKKQFGNFIHWLSFNWNIIVTVWTGTSIYFWEGKPVIPDISYNSLYDMICQELLYLLQCLGIFDSKMKKK